MDANDLIRKNAEKLKNIEFIKQDELTDPLQAAMCHFSVIGYEPQKIGELLNQSAEYVTMIISTEKSKSIIDEARKEIFQNDANKEFKSLSPNAAKIIKEIMNSVSERGATRLSAAMYALDRAHGKPIAQIDMGGSLIAKFIEILDNEKSEKVIDHSSQEIEDAILSSGEE